MNYSDRQAMCRVDFFRPSGKWYTTEAVDFGGLYDCDPAEALHRACERHFSHRLEGRLKGRLDGMLAVCLDPYTERSVVPLAIKLNWREPYRAEAQP